MSLVRDFRGSLRMMQRSPLQAAAIVVTMALAMLANTVVFSLADAVLLRPLQHPEPDRLVGIFTGTVAQPDIRTPATYLDVQDWQREARSFEWIAPMRFGSVSLTDNDLPERVGALRTTADLEQVLRFKPLAGRGILQEEVTTAASVALISEEMWETKYQRNPAVVGRVLKLDGAPVQVVGIFPRGSIPQLNATVQRTDVVLPLVLAPNERNRTQANLRVLARLRPGVTLEQANAEMLALNRQIEHANPNSHQDWVIKIVDLKEIVIGKVKPMISALAAAVAFLMLLACANIAGVMLGRMTTRSTEMAVRVALGAGRLRLVRQLITEALALTACGALLGVVGSYVALAVLRYGAGTLVPRIAEVQLDGRVILFCFLLTGVATLLIGIFPALLTSNVAPWNGLRQGGKGLVAGGGRLVLRWLVCAEIAIAVVLVVAAGLMSKTVLNLSQVSPGFDPKNLVGVQIDLPADRYPNQLALATFYINAIEKLKTHPAVEEVSATSRLPIVSGNQSLTYQTEGKRLPPTQWVWSDARLAGPRFVEAMRVPLLAGRDFEVRDEQDGAPPVVVVSKSFADLNWQGQNAVGQRLQVLNDKTPWREVVGVVGDIRMHGLDQDPKSIIYMPFSQAPFAAAARTSFLLLRVRGDEAALQRLVREEIARLDPSQAVAVPQNVETALAGSIGPQRLTAIVLAAFAVFSVTLALLGIYSVIALSVSTRTREIGTQIALGATKLHIYRKVVGEAAVLAFAAVTGGTLLALGVGKVLKAMLFAVGSIDPVTSVAAGVGLFVMAVLAGFIPARRATEVDPLEALRSE